MKKSFIKIMAVSSTALLLGGTFAPVVLAEETTSTTEAPADNSAAVTEAETPDQPEENYFLKAAREKLKEKIANSTLVSTDKEVLNGEADRAKSVEELEAIDTKLTQSEKAKADAEASETTEETEAPATTEQRIGHIIVFVRDSEGKIHRPSDELNKNTDISVSQGDKVLDKTQNDNWFTFDENTDSNQANDYQYTVTLPAGYKVVTDDVTLIDPYPTYAKQLKTESDVFQIVKGEQSYFIAIEEVPEAPEETPEQPEENIYAKAARDKLKEKIANSTLVSTDKEVLNAEADEAKSVEELEKIEEKLTQAEQAKSDAEKALALEAAKEKAIAELREAGVTSDFFLNKIREGKTIEGVEALKDELIKSHLDSSKPEEKPEETPVEKITFTLEVYRPGAEESFLTAKDEYETVEAAERGFKHYLNTAQPDHDFDWSFDADTNTFTAVQVQKLVPLEPATPVEKYTVRYELRNKEGKVIEVLQTEEGWTDWAIMEKSSVVVADKFAEKHGPWDVEAYADGLVYVFTAKEATPEPESSEESSTESSSEDKSTEVKKESKKETKKEEKKEKLPETGEVSSTAIFGAAALAILAGLGLVAPAFKKED